MRRRIALAFAAVALMACEASSENNSAARRSEAHAEILGREPLSPLPEAPEIDPRLVDLGRRLFAEKKLSSDGSVACTSCHNLAGGGDDGRSRSIGAGGKRGGINSPSIFNIDLNFVQFWDGRAATLDAANEAPFKNPAVMNMTPEALVGAIQHEADLAASFAVLFPDGVTAKNTRTALVAFERTLVTRDAPFDRWLGGDASAISGEQKAGYELFKSVGCVACHQGRNVGGNMFQRFGVLGDYFADRGNLTPADNGRFNVTHDEADRFVFRVPSLRNVGLTAPYFHDGSVWTLTDAVQVMAKYQLGRALSETDVSRLVAFLESLTGNRPKVDG